MSGRTITAILTAMAAALVAAILVVSSGDDGETDPAAPAASADTKEPSAADPPTVTDTDPDEPDAPCGVTLDEVQVLLPPNSGVTENATPDPGRCNFTRDDSAPAESGGRRAGALPQFHRGGLRFGGQSP